MALLLGDFNQNGVVELAEVNQVKAAFGSLGQRVEDVDGDQIVTIYDLTIVIANMLR